MARQFLCKLLVLVVVLALPSVNTMANPVSRETALRAATTELPRFFPGNWKLHEEFVLYDIDLQPAAYAFVFSREDQIKEAVFELPEGFVPKKHPSRNPDRQNTEIVPKENDHRQYSTIFISALDSEPPVIRCFSGLPPQRHNEERALTMADAEMPQNDASPVVRHLMLGFFDEAVAIINKEAPDSALVADLRGNQVLPLEEVRARVEEVKAQREPDPELVRLSRLAWQKHKTSGRLHGATLLQSDGGD